MAAVLTFMLSGAVFKEFFLPQMMETPQKLLLIPVSAYAIPGTDLTYGAIGLRNLRYRPSPTRCPVLSKHMVLPGLPGAGMEFGRRKGDSTTSNITENNWAESGVQNWAADWVQIWADSGVRIGAQGGRKVLIDNFPPHVVSRTREWGFAAQGSLRAVAAIYGGGAAVYGGSSAVCGGVGVLFVEGVERLMEAIVMWKGVCRYKGLT
eukprot:262791-Rhodomonas_salina.1